MSPALVEEQLVLEVLREVRGRRDSRALGKAVLCLFGWKVSMDFVVFSRGSDTPMSDFHHLHHQAEGGGTGSRASDSTWEALLQCFSMIAERCRWEFGKKLKNFR